MAGIRHKNREGEWVFYVLNDLFGENISYRTWDKTYTKILRDIHGRRKRIHLESDPDYYYTGRIFVSNWVSQKDYSKVTLKYVIDPYKQPLYTTGQREWLWNDLFANEIFYGRFTVDNSKHRNIVNPQYVNVTPTITCSSPMFVQANGASYSLPSGVSTEIVLKPGNNMFEFIGNGEVLVDYSTGKRI